jgi:hypothetical protein
MLESTRQNMTIDSKWATVAAQNEPRAIYDGTASQFAAAEKLLNSKKQIIAELQAELRTREAEYTELIEVAHKEDIDLMVQRMHEQFSELLSMCVPPNQSATLRLNPTLTSLVLTMDRVLRRGIAKD